MIFPFESPLQKLIREAAEREARKKALLGALYPSLLGQALATQPKRNVFISYHHENDQGWANLMRKTYADKYEIFYDSSLDDEVDSDDADYINKVIREDYIVGTSITIVLCGPETWKRRFVDWEIYSTLHHEHALLGVILSTATKNFQGNFIVPDRLYDNIAPGYAHWIHWPTNAVELKGAIEAAISKSSQTRLINNSREKMKKSLS
jgi:hypothetical protein